MSVESTNTQMGATAFQRESQQHRQQQQSEPINHITCIEASTFAAQSGDVTAQDPNVPSDN